MSNIAATNTPFRTAIPLPAEHVLDDLPAARGPAIPTPKEQDVLSVERTAAALRSTPPADLSLTDALMQGKPVIASRHEVSSRLNPFQDGSTAVWITDGTRNPDGGSRAVAVVNVALGGNICSSNGTGAIVLPAKGRPESFLVIPLAMLGGRLPGSPHIHEPGENRLNGPLELSPGKTAAIQALLRADAFPVTFSR
jgi:hypothetical protein